VLVTRPGQLGAEQHAWVAVLAAGPGALLAGLAAATAGGLRGQWQRTAIDVLVPGDRRSPDLLGRLPADLPAVKVRRTGTLPDEDRQPARPDRTTMARSVVDAAQWAPNDSEARAVVAAACQQGRALPAEILAVADRMPRARRRQLVLTTATDAAGGAGSLAEIDFVRLCRAHRLPEPDLQRKRTDTAGRVRYLDAYWERFGIHVEVDGGHHTEVGEWESDMRRQNDVWIAGDMILRFPATQIRQNPHEVAQQLLRALRSRGFTRDLGRKW
jgi:very-short-patch-repair endonuclease